MKTISSLFIRILPFIWLGIMLVLAVVGIVLFSYVLVVGAIVGLIIFAIAYIRNKFSSKGPYRPVERYKPSSKEQGRTIDSKDLED